MIRLRLLIAATLLIPPLAVASDTEIARLAGQLQQASHALSQDARGVTGFGSVHSNAARLGDKAQQLLESLRRGRTSAHVRTRFTDVSRYYQRLEAAVLRGRSSQATERVRQEFYQLADLYENLRYQFYGDSYYQSFRASPPAFGPYPPHYGGEVIRGPGLGITPIEPGSRSHRQMRHDTPGARPAGRRESGQSSARRGNSIEANQGYYRLRQ
jgi:hypothetical protein